MHLDHGMLESVSVEGLREWLKGKNIPGRTLSPTNVVKELYGGVKYYFGDRQELSTAQSTALRKAAALRTRKRHKHQIVYEKRVKLGRENPLSDGLVKSCLIPTAGLNVR